ncbi:MAG TPA: magnesium transporter [Gammaproteobacteria bacterium]|nr:magnesium transporter [Gammaproteobacteria bacterium]
MQSLDQFQAERQLEQFSELLAGGRLKPVSRMLNALHPGEIAHLLESTPPGKRKLVWSLVDPDIAGEVLVELGDEVRSSLIEGMNPKELIVAAEGMETDDLADLIQDLPETVTSEILKLMDHQDRKRLEAVLAFEEDTAGGLMNTDTVTVRADVTVEVVLRYLRLRGHLPRHTNHLIVVDRYERYQGVLRMEVLVTADVDLLVATVMQQDIPAISADIPATEVAKIFAKRDLISAAVVDDKGRLLGRITVDDVVDIFRDEAEHNLMSRGGLNEEDDIFSPVLNSSKRRAVWLGVNLLTAFLASWVIGQFQETLEKVVALAVLMPIVASMGGVAGTQTLTLVIRGIALDQVGKKNINWLLFKEISVGFINGLFWAAIVAAITILWFGSVQIGGIIAAAMVVNLFFAALAGVLIPMVMRSLAIDPALAGGVVLTTVTDVIGFVTFLGLATLILQ